LYYLFCTINFEINVCIFVIFLSIQINLFSRRIKECSKCVSLILYFATSLKRKKRERERVSLNLHHTTWKRLDLTRSIEYTEWKVGQWWWRLRDASYRSEIFVQLTKYQMYIKNVWAKYVCNFSFSDKYIKIYKYIKYCGKFSLLQSH